MPNHVITEIRFSDVSAEKRAEIIGLCSGPEGEIDFETLLPPPLNVWKGSAGTRHEKAFGKQNIALEWSRANWGTKWNAYGLGGVDGAYQSVVEGDGTLTLTFKTAWSTPYGWILALWHAAGVPLSYSFLDEGASSAKTGRFTAYGDDMINDPWREDDATPEEHRRMHKLLWGVEEFEPEPT